MMDPCCGSGTNLFMARRLGFKVIGSDVNSDFIAGTMKNMNYAGYGYSDSGYSESGYNLESRSDESGDSGDKINDSNEDMLQLYIKVMYIYSHMYPLEHILFIFMSGKLSFFSRFYFQSFFHLHM